LRALGLNSAWPTGVVPSAGDAVTRAREPLALVAGVLTLAIQPVEACFSLRSHRQSAICRSTTDD